MTTTMMNSQLCPLDLGDGYDNMAYSEDENPINHEDWAPSERQRHQYKNRQMPFESDNCATANDQHYCAQPTLLSGAEFYDINRKDSKEQLPAWDRFVTPPPPDEDETQRSEWVEISIRWLKILVYGITFA